MKLELLFNSKQEIQSVSIKDLKSKVNFDWLTIVGAMLIDLL